MRSFGPYRFDVSNACIWHKTSVLRPSSKACAVLGALLDRAGQLVSKDDLLQAGWPDVAVSDAVLTVCIGELRRLLGDSARKPVYIETVHRHGYRFVAPLTDRVQLGSATNSSQVHPPTPRLVGRQAELRRLHAHFEKAQHGIRQLVLISGEAGIGKSALLDAFVAQLADTTPLWTARGQCIAHYGKGEAYLPMLDALGHLCRQADGEQVLALLKQYAPSWLLRMPSLFSDSEFDALKLRTQGVTPEGMLREIAETLEALTTVQPLVLILEDLHGCDMATVDLLAWLARRQQPARLLLLATYQPVETIVRQHPLRSVSVELAVRKLCKELPLELLNEVEVREYLRAQSGRRIIPRQLSSLFHQRTAGNPLFLVNLLDTLDLQGMAWDDKAEIQAALAEVPQGLRMMIEQRLAQCDAVERQVLEAASVAGSPFTVASLAVAIEPLKFAGSGPAR